MEIFQILIGLVILFAVIILPAIVENNMRRPWQRFAQANGLTFVPGHYFLGPPSVTGDYQGCSLTLAMVVKDDDLPYTRLQLSALPDHRIDQLPPQFPLGQQFSPGEIEAFLIPSASAFRPNSGMSEIIIRDRGRHCIYDQRGYVIKEEDLQNIANFLIELSKNYSYVLVLGGEATAALQSMAAATVTAGHPLKLVSRHLLDDIATETASRLGKNPQRWLCPRCLTYCTKHNTQTWLQSVAYYGCRTCKQSRQFLKGPVVAILDNQMETELAEQPDRLQFNWLCRRKLFDFSQIEIIRASDEEVERFAVQVGNDTDP